MLTHVAESQDPEMQGLSFMTSIYRFRDNKQHATRLRQIVKLVNMMTFT